MKIDMKNDIPKLKVFLIFLYLLFFYIFGSDSSTVMYSEIILLLFIGLEFIDILNERKLKISIPIIIAFIFAFYCFLSHFWAISPDLSINKSKTLLVLSAFLLLTYNFFISIKDGQDKLLKIIMWAGTFFSIYVIMYYGIGEYFARLLSGERMGAEIDNVNSIGLQTSIAFIIAFFYGLYKNKKLYLILSIIPLIVSLGTGSRKVIVLIVISILLLLFFKNSGKFDMKKLAKTLVITIICIIGFIYISRLPMFANTFERFEKMINGITGTGQVDNSTEVRFRFIEAGFEQFLQTPILGIGIGNSGYVTMKADGWFTYLHNNYVELLATTGIIGFVLFYSMHLYIVINCLKQLKKRNEYIIIILIIFLVNLILDYGIVSYYSKNTYIYILLGIVTIEKIRKKRLNYEEKNN